MCANSYHTCMYACIYVCMYVCMYIYMYVCTRYLRKNCAKLFLSELRQISINFNNLWEVDGKMAEILFYIYIFHLTSLMSSHYLVKHESTRFYSFSGKQ